MTLKKIEIIEKITLLLRLKDFCDIINMLTDGKMAENLAYISALWESSPAKIDISLPKVGGISIVTIDSGDFI